MIFSEFSPSNIVKLENVGPMLSNSRLLLSYSFVTTLYTTFVTSTVHFRFIPTHPLDFQVLLNLVRLPLQHSKANMFQSRDCEHIE